MKGAGVGIRAVATIIDFVAIIVIAAVFFAVWGEDGACDSAANLSYKMDGDTTAVCGGPAWLFFAAVLAYWVVLEAMLGATLGKLMTGLRVVRDDGSPVSWPGAVIRTLLRVVDGACLYLVAAIAVWSSSGNQRLGDMAAKTYVVRRAS